MQPTPDPIWQAERTGAGDGCASGGWSCSLAPAAMTNHLRPALAVFALAVFVRFAILPWIVDLPVASDEGYYWWFSKTFERDANYAVLRPRAMLVEKAKEQERGEDQQEAEARFGPQVVRETDVRRVERKSDRGDQPGQGIVANRTKKRTFGDNTE